MSTLVSVNLSGVVEQAEVGASPYRVSADGEPYVPVGDGGIVLGLQLGDDACRPDVDHAAPGACITASDAAAAYALCAYACVGNPVQVRSGAAAGADGAVLGKRGEGSRVIVVLEQDALARLRPGDLLSVRARGQQRDPRPSGVSVLNASPNALAALGIDAGSARLSAHVRGIWPSRHVGNGIGRPSPMWSVELSGPFSAAAADAPRQLRLGDLVAIRDLDARFNAGYRRGSMTLGLVVHSGSPLPGHGPGVMAIASGPADAFGITVDGDEHLGLNEATLMEVAREQH